MKRPTQQLEHILTSISEHQRVILDAPLALPYRSSGLYLTTPQALLGFVLSVTTIPWQLAHAPADNLFFPLVSMYSQWCRINKAQAFSSTILVYHLSLRRWAPSTQRRLPSLGIGSVYRKRGCSPSTQLHPGKNAPPT